MRKCLAAVDSRLERAISSPKLREQVGELVRLAMTALEDLKQLDESLYERFVSTRTNPQGPEAVAAGMRQLWEDTFRGLHNMLAYARTLAAPPSDEPPAEEASFDFGDFAEAAPASSRDSLDFAGLDIGGLLEGLDGDAPADEQTRWNSVLEKIGSIEYGMTQQLKDAHERMENALRSGETNQVLGLLDDTQSSTSEGVHALVAAIYEEFCSEVNVATVVPGYLTSLGRALLVRRGLADLATKLTPQNNLLQGEDPTEYEFALAQIRIQMRQFVGSVVCRAMRAADRWQIVEFERELTEQPLKVARLTSEGLVKYIDSLSSVNQREVLVVHDTRTLGEMREALSSARQLLDISPRAARDEMDRAYQAAQRLRGRHPVTDELIIGLERYAPASSNAGDVAKYLEQLEAVLAASP
jgi:hypothetical protein